LVSCRQRRRGPLNRRMDGASRRRDHRQEATVEDALSKSALDPRWLAEQLEDGAEALVCFWAALPPERQAASPPAFGGFAPFGEWTAHRHLFHLVHYERQFALPALRAAVEGAPSSPSRTDEDAAYRPDLPAADLLGELRDLRARQAALLRRADAAALARTVAPWQRSALWSAAKTVQHTADHLNTLGQLALFWDFARKPPDGAAEHPFAGLARRWLLAMQECVRSLDYARARTLFAEDVVAFGTRAGVVAGRAVLEREQWSRVWPRIRDFTFRLDELRVYGGDHALCVMAPWDSLGVRPDGAATPRPGRATVLLAPRGGDWLAVHSHFSLLPPPQP
jgi:ketosteroid isomerase-like protein